MTLAICLMIFFGFYLFVNLGRLVKGRMNPVWRQQVFWKTLAWLIGLEVVAFCLGLVLEQDQISGFALFYLVTVGQLVGSLVIFLSTFRHLSKIKPPTLSNNYASRDLPTLSVCVPARNETVDLEKCLTTLVASDYPKLEILVLDDSSQERRTPEIIRSFAQSGVRFLAGKEPSTRWLAKNYAYQQLAEAANGDYLLFCGVDTRFEPQTLSLLLKLLMQKDKSMFSVIPKNIYTDAPLGLKSLLIQPSRYAWELALPRRLLQRPPVLSTCWLIKRTELKATGGFAAVSHKAVPESYFANFTASHSDGYSFIQADSSIGLSSQKTFAEQLSTAVRTRYPQLHRRPEITALTTLAELIILVLPFSFLLAAIAASWLSLAMICAASCVLLAWHYAAIVRLTYGRFMWIALLTLPFIALYDIGLLNYSMFKYEFGTVLWKGRDITAKVMSSSL